MTFAADLRRDIAHRLTDSVGQREARAMSDIIMEQIASLSAVDIALNPQRELSDDTVARIKTVTDRVIAGQPLQYVLGVADFHGLQLHVEPGVLIPRPETSQLVDIITDSCGDRADLRILDVCTGSGAIAAALGRSLRFPQLWAVDLSDKALQVADRNFTDLKLTVNLTKVDVLSQPLPAGPFDIIVSNPPYVDNSERATMDARVLDHEPAMALFVPDDNPLLFYRRIASQGRDILVAGGELFFEINPRHASLLEKMLTDMGYDDVAMIRDFTGRERFAKARQPIDK